MQHGGIARAIALVIRRQLGHDLFRTTVSVGAVASGVIIAIAVNAIMSGFETKFVNKMIEISPHIEVFEDPVVVEGEFSTQLSEHTGGVVTLSNEPPSPEPPRIDKPEEVLESLSANPAVEAAAPNVVGTAIMQFGGREARTSLVGIDPARQQEVVDIERDLVSGTLTDLHASGGGVLLGQGLSDKLGARRGDFISVVARRGELRTVKVVGVFYTGVTLVDLRRAYTLINTAQELLGTGIEINRIVLRLGEFENAVEVAGDIEDLTGKRTIPWQEANTHAISLLNTNKTLTVIVSIGVLVVAAFGILNVLMMMVVDKVDSIALLKSIGYSPRDIALAYLGLGICVGLLGVAVGCSVGYYVVEILDLVPIPRLALVDTDTLLVNNLPRHYLLAGGIALLVSALAAVLPALRAGSLDPVEILRGRN